MKKLIIFIMIMMPVAIYAQDDFGIWASIGAEKKLSKKFKLGIDGGFRSRNNAKTADRWSVGLDASYKLNNYVKFGAGYTFLYDNRKEDISYKSSGAYNKWRPSYWTTKHRIHADVTGNIDAGNFNFSLRERWQYTYRPENTVDRYDFDDEEWEEKTYSAKHRHVLRSRFQVEYDINNCPVTPYANVELYNKFSLSKVRYTVGADLKIAKQHTFGLYYRYQNAKAEEDDETDMNTHILGINYKFKF